MANVRRRAPHERLIFRSIRVDPETFARIEAIAARESISVNALCNALFAVTLDLDHTDEGRARLHQACTDWRSRWEYKETGKRQRRLEGE